MSTTWPLQRAKNQFSRVVDQAISEGPQTVTRHGRPVVVVTAVARATATRRGSWSARKLLALIRTCPVDLSTVVRRDRSAPREIALR
jgi:prevent-host-death family protein